MPLFSRKAKRGDHESTKQGGQLGGSKIISYANKDKGALAILHVPAEGEEQKTQEEKQEQHDMLTGGLKSMTSKSGEVKEQGEVVTIKSFKSNAAKSLKDERRQAREAQRAYSFSVNSRDDSHWASSAHDLEIFVKDQGSGSSTVDTCNAGDVSSIGTGASENYDANPSSSASMYSSADDISAVEKQERGKAMSQASSGSNRSLEMKLRSLHNSACLDLKRSNVNQAISGFEKILDLLTNQYGDKHKRVATALHNLGVAHSRAGNIDDAEDALDQAIKIRKKKLGSSSPKVADSLVELGTVLLAQEQFDDALEALNEALTLRKCEAAEIKMMRESQSAEFLNANAEEMNTSRVKLQIAKIHNNIGCALYEYGDLANAKDSFLDAHAKQVECFEEGNFSSMPGYIAMATTVCNIGFVYMEMEQWMDAAKKLEEGLKIQQNVLETTSLVILNTIENLAYSYLSYGAMDKALKTYNLLFDIIRSSHDKYDPFLINGLKKKAYCQIKLYEYEPAIYTLKRIEQILLNTSNRSTTTATQIVDLEELTAAIHVQVYKFPSIKEFIAKSITIEGYRNPLNPDLMCRCGYDVENEGELDLRFVRPLAPPRKTKMSGHKISYA